MLGPQGFIQSNRLIYSDRSLLMTVKLLSRVHWFTSCLMINSSLFSCLLRNAQILHESPIMSIQIIHPSSGIWQLKDDCIVIFIITVQFLRGFFHRAERAVVGLSDVKKTPVVLLCVYKKIVWGFCDPCAAWAGPCRAVWFDEKCAAAAVCAPASLIACPGGVGAVFLPPPLHAPHWVCCHG